MTASSRIRPVPRAVREAAGRRANAPWLLVALAFILIAPTAHAQDSQSTPQESRWWAGAGAGYLASHAVCTGCDPDAPYHDNAAFLVAGGLRVNRRLLIGGELFSTGRTAQGTQVRDTYVIATAQYRPFGGHGFFLKGGYGVAIVKDAVPSGTGTFTARTWGMGLMYGAGWVFRERSRISVAPVGATYVTTVGDVRTQAGAAENVVVNGWFAGIVVMFR